MSVAKKVEIVVLQTYQVKQYNMGIVRENGETIPVKVFVAPYAVWWIDRDNLPIELPKEEIDALHQQLRLMGQVRKAMNTRPQELATVS